MESPIPSLSGIIADGTENAMMRTCFVNGGSMPVFFGAFLFFASLAQPFAYFAVNSFLTAKGYAKGAKNKTALTLVREITDAFRRTVC